MKTPRGSAVVLHLEFGGDFLKAVLDQFGVEAWNGWLNALVARVPPWWEEGEDQPPACPWFDADGIDLSGWDIRGLDLGLVTCERARFDGARAAGALLGDVRHASFRGVDLRDATFIGDVTGAVFAAALLDGASFADAEYDANAPPLGLPDALLRQCDCQSHDERLGAESAVGLVEYPVSIRASLAESATR